jgi:hypothetical protein
MPRGSSSFWLPGNLSDHMDRQARTRDTMLVMSREMTGRSQRRHKTKHYDPDAQNH